MHDLNRKNPAKYNEYQIAKYTKKKRIQEEGLSP